MIFILALSLSLYISISTHYSDIGLACYILHSFLFHDFVSYIPFNVSIQLVMVYCQWDGKSVFTSSLLRVGQGSSKSSFWVLRSCPLSYFASYFFKIVLLVEAPMTATRLIGVVVVGMGMLPVEAFAAKVSTIVAIKC